MNFDFARHLFAHAQLLGWVLELILHEIALETQKMCANDCLSSNKSC